MRSSIAVIAVALVSCASPLQQAMLSERASSSDLNTSMAAMQAQMLVMKEGQASAERDCERLRLMQPTWVEERAVGERLAISLAGKTGHFLLEGVTEKDPQKLAVQRPAALPEGEKNAITAHVAVVGKNLARFSSRPELPWVFGVIENDRPDALSAPGGYVFVTTGLLKKMTNEAQLAGVLAHEIDHVAEKHALAKYVDARHRQCVVAKFAAYAISHQLTSMPGSALAAAQFAPNFDGYDLDKADGKFATFIMDALMTVMMMSGNERDAELETDKTALELVAFAGYDATEYEKFLTSLGEEKNGITAQHPKTDDRVAKLKALREGELKDFVHGTAKPDLGKVFAPLGR